MLGMKIICNDLVMSDHAGWDFSRCRSPSRAARRHRKRSKWSPISKMVREIREPKREAYRVGDMLIMHSAMAAEVSKATQSSPARPWL